MPSFRNLRTRSLDRLGRTILRQLNISALFTTKSLKSVKLDNYPLVHYESYLNSISFHNIKVKTSNVVKSGVFFDSLLYWANNAIAIVAAVAYTISFFKNDEESLYYGNFNGYFMFENKMVLDIITCYILYFTLMLKVFYTQYTLEDGDSFSWLNIFRLFHRDIEPKVIALNDRMASKLWRSTLAFNSLTTVLIHVEVLFAIGVYTWVYFNLPDYFKYSGVGLAILIGEFILIINIFKTFESFYFLFSTVCKYLDLRTDYVLGKLNNYEHTFERKINDRLVTDSLKSIDETDSLLSVPFASDLKQEFDPYLIFAILQQHNAICSLVHRYNFFWRFYLFTVFFTMPIIIGYFVFLLTFDNMHYVHRISLALIIVILISYFYLVTSPAVYLSGKIQKIIFPLKMLGKYRLPSKIKYKIETYLTRFETKVAFNCYGMFDVTSETYLDFFFVAGSLLFLTMQLFSGNLQYKLSSINN